MKYILISLMLSIGFAQTLEANTDSNQEHDQQTHQAKEVSTAKDLEITLFNGEKITGEFVDMGDYLLGEKDGYEIKVPKSQIIETKEIKLKTINGKKVDSRLGRTRHLYSPSAFMLEQGEVTLSQKQLIFTSVGIGLTDQISAQIGTVIPLIFNGPNNLYIGALKMGTSWSEYFHSAIGVQGFFIEDQSLTIPFLTTTLGTPDAQITYNLSFPNSRNNGEVLHNVSGQLRVSRGVGLIAETYKTPVIDQPIVAGATRLYGKHLYVDLGLAFMIGEKGTMPWVDFSYEF